MSTYRFFVSILLTFCLSLDVIAHQKPHITNFARDKYHASNKNWSIGQDERGIMYFGNDTGLLESDGIEWNLYTMPNKSFIKALCVVSHNQIYTGGFEDFGVWNRTKSGELTYNSLAGLLPDKSLDNQSFWRIWKDNDKIYFQSFTNIYVYNHQTIERLTNSVDFLLLNKVRDEFLVQEMYGSLFQLKNGQLNKMEGSEFMNGTLTRVVLSYPNNQYLLGTSTGELFLYDRKNFIPWNNVLSRQLNGKELNCGIYCSKRNSYYLGTLLDGIYEVDTEGKILNHFAAPNSLQNNTILAIYEDLKHNIWVAMDHGLAYIRYTDGLSYFHTTERNSLAIYDATIWNDLLFLGTNQGVYIVQQSKLDRVDVFSSLKLIKGTEGQVWSFRKMDESLYCCHNNGLLEICKNLSIRQPYRIDCGVFKLMDQIIDRQQIYLCTTYKELHVINPKNKEVIRINYPTDQINNAEFDHVGNIWLETTNRGIYRCKLSEDLKSFRYSSYYGHERNENLPVHLQVSSASGRIFFLGDNHFYTYNESENELQLDPLLNQCFADIQDIKRIIPINNEESWAITSSSVYRFYYDGYLARIKESYKIEANNLSLITAYENISVLNDTLSLICLDTGFILHNSQHSQKEIKPLDAPSLKYIQSDGNFTNFFEVDKEIKIPFDENTITVGFFVSNAFIDNLAVEYKMDGVDSAWSDPQRMNSASYARLPHGKYTLHLRSTDGTSNYSPVTTVNFEILPPWYKTIWWYLTCVLFIVLALIGSYWVMKKRWHTQHLKRLKVLENEQLRSLNERLQHEIEVKNAELFTQTSFIIHKNGLILELKSIIDEIIQVNSQKSIIPLTRRINVLLTENLNTEDDWKMFLIKFEQKHPYFFKSLKEDYPILTNNDLRLCACLKLNMETKDIASLMNLSVRAVENNRYRLRKKLDLKPNQNLNEFFLLIE